MNFWRNLIIGLLGIAFFVLIFISLQKGDILNTIIGFIFMIVLIILIFFKMRNIKEPIPKHIVIEKYKELMGERYNVSINKNCVLYRDAETPEEYVIVLKDIDEEDMNIRYFPFECNKFKLLFGRGTGAIFYKVSEAWNWLYQNSRIGLKPEIFVDLSEKARLETLKDMTKEDEYRGGEIAENG